MTRPLAEILADVDKAIAGRTAKSEYKQNVSGDDGEAVPVMHPTPGHKMHAKGGRDGDKFYGKHDAGIYSYTHLNHKDITAQGKPTRPNQKWVHDEVKKQNPHLSDEHARAAARTIYRDSKHYYENEDK